MRRSKFILLLLESYFLNCRTQLATLHKNPTEDLLHHVTMHVISKHTKPPITGTRDRLACMPVDRGKSWEPAHTS